MTVRIISAIVMAVMVTLVIFFAPPLIFKGIILLLIMGGLYEFFKLALPAEPIYQEAGWIWGIALASSILFLKGPYAFLTALLAGLFIVTLIYMKNATTLEGVTSKIGLTLLGAVYLGATLPFFGLARELSHGRALIFMGISAAAMSDTFALFGGKAFGRHKFAPLTSPNKTMEGFAAGLIGSVLAVFVVRQIAWADLPLHHVVIIGILIGFIGPMGDLIESLFKRDYHVKDSGHIIPGHGGFLDRLDAMIFVGPFVYLYARFL
ncbi:MAG: phosphatidate cytidylyltransferase [Deltaproteobacteria bacterium]|nr:phosphatidate cytidylyltransferase [Deltaproteobacteria bacterium]